MTTPQPTAPGPHPLPRPPAGSPAGPDPRLRDIVLDHPDMHALVAGLVLPVGASMYVMSTLETARELIRHSSYRYEFATVAVTHSLLALEHVLTERLAVEGPLGELIERAAGAGLVLRELNGGLDGDGVAALWACVADLARTVPLLDETYCAAYFTTLHTLAVLAASRHTPTAH